jgi:hypothetical protein
LQDRLATAAANGRDNGRTNQPFRLSKLRPHSQVPGTTQTAPI